MEMIEEGRRREVHYLPKSVDGGYQSLFQMLPLQFEEVGQLIPAVDHGLRPIVEYQLQLGDADLAVHQDLKIGVRKGLLQSLMQFLYVAALQREIVFNAEFLQKHFSNTTAKTVFLIISRKD